MSATATLLDQLRQLSLLEPEQLDEVEATLHARFPEPKALAKELLQRDWLTAYQANLLLQGRGRELVLGSYVLLEKLGEGGMGAVFKARHQTLGRVVALKLVRKERLDNANAVRRFRREIKAAAQLNHPNVVLAFDADEVAGAHFFTMEYVEGTDLSKLVKEKGPLPVEQAADCIRQAALGLQAAHERGLVHRDIKPANLLLQASRDRQGAPASPPLPDGRRSQGVVKVMDLGLARGGQTGDESASTLTQENSVMGTPDYIAPEQSLNAHTADIRADLYSLGCTLYFLLTGRVPFPGGSLGEKLLKHQLQDPVPVEQLRPETPAWLAAVVRKLMAKKPEDRYQTPAALAAALANGGRQPPGPAPALGNRLFQGADAPRSPEPATVVHGPARRRSQRSPRSLWLLAGLASVVLFLGVLGYALLSSRSSTPRAVNGPARKSSSTPFASEPLPAEFEPLPGKEYVANSIGMVFVKVPAGKFLMGSPDSDLQGRPEEKPQHEVTLTGPFYLGVFEVTQDHYQQVMGITAQSSQEPASGVTWTEAVEFCQRLSSRPEEVRAGRGYRLPTEAEWEYACRAGTTASYHFGPDSDSSQYALHDRTSVGSFKPNAFGLHDMHGNVWEWCSDAFTKYDAGPATDPHEPAQGKGQVVLRGGGARDQGAANCRSATRFNRSATFYYPSIGFRVVCFPAESPAVERPALPLKAVTRIPFKEYVTNTLGMQFVRIPAGKFQMGSPPDEKGRQPDEDPHEVEITRPFYLGIHEVTAGQYQHVMGGGYRGSFRDRVSEEDSVWLPADSVSWNDAQEFCKRLSSLAAEQQAGRTYRLPTEAEWEYACRAGADPARPFNIQGTDGLSLSALHANFDGKIPYGVGQRYPNLGRTAVVGSYPANAFGLFDMHGNVLEWCQDRYAPYPQEKPQDPVGLEGRAGYVLRGGSWAVAGHECRAARRKGGSHDFRYWHNGFRLVCVTR